MGELCKEAGGVLGDDPIDPAQLPAIRCPTHVDVLADGYVGYTRALGRLCAGASVLCKYSCIVFTLYLRVFTAPLFSRYVYFVNHSQGWERVVWARFAVIYNIL